MRWGAIFLVLLMFLLVAGRGALLRDPGTFWHTRLGLEAWSTGQFGRHDRFTFTCDGHPWLPVQWLGDMLLAAAFAWGGWDTVVLLTAASLSALYAWLACRAMAAGLASGAALVLLVLLLGASSHHFHARPHLASIAGMGLTCAVLCDVGSGRAPLSRLLVLLPLLIVWTNLHGGVLAGLASVWFVALGWLVAGLRTSPSVGHALRYAAALLALLVVLSCALLVNPFGIAMPGTWFTILQMPLPTVIQEHRPLSLARPEGGMVLLLGGLYLAVLCGIGRGRRRAHDWLPAVWLCLSFARVRHAPLFAIAAGIVLADMLPRSRWAPMLARRGWLRRPAAATWLPYEAPPRAAEGAAASPADASHLCDGQRTTAVILAGHQPVSLHGAAPGDRPHAAEPTRPDCQPLAGPAHVLLLAMGRRRLGRVALLVVAIAALLQGTPCRVPVIGSGWAQVDARYWPIDLLPHLDRLASQSGPAPRVLNALHYGGFLTMYAPQWRTFIDDRCELFGTRFLAAYAHAEQHCPWYLDAWAQQYDVRVALVPSGSAFDSYLRQAAHWEPVARGRSAALFQRRPSDSACESPLLSDVHGPSRTEEGVELLGDSLRDGS
jgi:hypothetical protein